MKKLLLGSVILTFFAFSIILFQASCQKEAVANTESAYTLPPATTATLGGVIVGSGLNVTANGTLSVTSSGVTQQNKIFYKKGVKDPSNSSKSIDEIWSANYDGSNQKKLSVTLPLDSKIVALSISPDRQSLFFSVWGPLTANIYTCKTDGSGLTKIIDGANLGYESLNSPVAF